MKYTPLFSFSTKELTILTMSTCIFGGILWISRAVKILKDNFDVNARDTSTGKDVIFWKNAVYFCDSLSVKVVLSVFYSYLALNVNSFLLASNFITVDVLSVGYATVCCGIVIESFQIHMSNLRKWFRL